MSDFWIIDQFNILDFILILILLVALFSGYRLGLLQSLFKAIGYILGGLVGIYLALNHLEQFGSTTIKLLLALILILLSALSLEYILGKIGLLLHKGLLFAPFKAVDSLFGALLSIVKNLIIFYLLASVLLFSNFKQLTTYIDNSYIYSFLDQHLPKIFTDSKSEVDKLI
jgi:uncharacterized membrane protein required for colicin V production